MLSERAMLVNLHRHAWRGKKLDKIITQEIVSQYGIEGNPGEYNKSLISKDEIDKIWKISGKIYNWHRDNTLPWLDGGDRILPAKLFINYRREMHVMIIQFKSAVEYFCKIYPDLRIRAEHELNGAFNENDYPAADDIRSKFSIYYTINPVPVANDFRADLSEKEQKEIQNEINTRCEQALAVASKEIWDRLYNVVNSMFISLSQFNPDATGKERGVFRDSLVGNVVSLTAILPHLNITDDDRLYTLTREVENKLGQVPPQELRDDSAKRNSVMDDAEDIMNRMKGYMGVA